MDDPSALITAARRGDGGSLRRLLEDAQRSLRLTAALMLPTLRDADLVVRRLGPLVAGSLATAPDGQPMAWLRGCLRTLIGERLDELERSPAYAGDPLGRLLVSAGRERLDLVPADSDPANALGERLRFLTKGATDLLALRFSDGLSLAQIAERRHLSLDDVSMALQTACRQLDWTGDASGGTLEPGDYRALDGLVCGSDSTIDGLGSLRARVLDDLGLGLRAVRAARWHVITAAWYARALDIEVPVLATPAPPARASSAVHGPVRPPSSTRLPAQADKRRGFPTPTRRQAAQRGAGSDAPSLDTYPEQAPRSGLLPTLIGGALVLIGVLVMFLRGGSTELPAGASPANAPATAPVPAPAAQPQPPGTAATPVPAAAPTVAAAMPLPARGVIASSLATWSTRLVIAGYDGPLLRLRRSGDHAEQDVGHAADGALDTAAASAFTGQGSAYVVAWYDQSGHRHHLRQGERDHQPRLIIDGTLQRENSRPVIVFERPRFDHLTTPVGIPIGCLYALVKVVQHGNETQAIMGSRSDSGVDSDAYYPIVDRLGKGTCEWWLGLTQDYTILTAPITRGRLLLWHSSQGGGARPRLTLRLDGKEVAAGIAAHDALVPMGPTMVGGLYWARKPGDPFGGALGELIVLPPGSSDEVRATITRELMAWWKIP